MYQRSLKSVVNIVGIGVHTGEKSWLSIHPAPADFGIRFTPDQAPRVHVRACPENVSDTTLSTTLSDYGHEVGTVEHLMASLWATGVDNAQIVVRGREIPIMDGSAKPFIEAIEASGIQELDRPKKVIRITRELSVSQGDAAASLVPSETMKVGYTFVADHPVFNRYPKSLDLDFSETDFKTEVAAARSFGLIDELPRAQAINRCLGSSMLNAVAIGSNDVLNPEGLRYRAEFIKHKILDVLGDLYLLGHPILGEFQGYMSGHALNNKLSKALVRCPDAWVLETDETVSVMPYLAGIAAG